MARIFSSLANTCSDHWRNFFHLAVVVGGDSQRKFVASPVVEGVIVLCVGLFRHSAAVVFDLMELSGAKLYLLDFRTELKRLFLCSPRETQTERMLRRSCPDSR